MAKVPGMAMRLVASVRPRLTASRHTAPSGRRLLHRAPLVVTAAVPLIQKTTQQRDTQSRLAALAAAGAGLLTATAMTAAQCEGDADPKDGGDDAPTEVDTSSYVQVTARRHHTDAVGHITSRYEDKIRYFANSDKVFRYFATVKVDGVVYMRPQDFIRSVTPGEMQPEELGLDLYQNYGSDAAGVVGTAAEDEPLLQYNVDGTFKETNILLSFTEYKFLLTMLTAPKKDYDIAFRLVDLDGNGKIELDEFLGLSSVVASRNKTGRRNNEAIAKSAEMTRSYLLRHLFHKDGTGFITPDTFRKFIDELQHDVLVLDFLLHRQNQLKDGVDQDDDNDDNDNSAGTSADKPGGPASTKPASDGSSRGWWGSAARPASAALAVASPPQPSIDEATCDLTISEIGLAKMILKHARITAEKRKSYYDKVNERYPKGNPADWTITCAEVSDLFTFMNHIDEFDLAVHMLDALKGEDMVRADLQRIAAAVSDIDLSDQMADLVFLIFSLEDKTNLNDFVITFRNAKNHGMSATRSRPRGLGIFELYKCMKEQYQVVKE